MQFSFHEPLFGCILETRPTGHVFGAIELLDPASRPSCACALAEISKARSPRNRSRRGRCHSPVIEDHRNARRSCERRSSWSWPTRAATLSRGRRTSAARSKCRPGAGYRARPARRADVANRPGFRGARQSAELDQVARPETRRIRPKFRACDIIMTGSFVRPFRYTRATPPSPSSPASTRGGRRREGLSADNLTRRAPTLRTSPAW